LDTINKDIWKVQKEIKEAFHNFDQKNEDLQAKINDGEKAVSDFKENQQKLDES